MRIFSTESLRGDRKGRRSRARDIVASGLLLWGCGRRTGEANGATAQRAVAEDAPGNAANAPSVSAQARSESRSTAPFTDVATANARDAASNDWRIVRFPWRPPAATGDAYAMDEPEDQHRIALPPDLVPGATYPVLVAFHGQPKRGEAPRNYAFPTAVIDTVFGSVKRREVRPLVLVVPVFRFFGTNWPEFDVESFRSEVDRRLAAEQIKASGYFAVGHSGAAGCGGDGMNRVHRMRPTAVGFFDTCLGPGWRDEVKRLRDARIQTLLIHSLETAGFSPRQSTEYLPTFDFGRAYGPAGLFPGDCPIELPRAPLRAQPFRCSVDTTGNTRGLIVDSGEGERGHNALVPIALEYFLKEYVGVR